MRFQRFERKKTFNSNNKKKSKNLSQNYNYTLYQFSVLEVKRAQEML